MHDKIGPLPTEAEEIYQGFLSRPLATVSMLHTMVEQYLEIVLPYLTDLDSHASRTARQVGGGLLTLLEDCPEEQLRHVQAAALYFASYEDAQPDIESDDGFDDDAEVFNAVCDLVGRDELKVRQEPTTVASI